MDGDIAFVIDVEQGNQCCCVGDVEDVEDRRSAVVTFVDMDIARGEPWISLLRLIRISNGVIFFEGYLFSC